MRRRERFRVEAYQWHNGHILAVRDLAAGRAGRFTLLILAADGALIVGRELPIGHCERLAAKCVATLDAGPWFGRLRQARRLLKAGGVAVDQAR